MTALQYLFFTKIKNRIKQFFKKPAQIVYLVVMIALVVFMLRGGNSPSGGLRPGSDPRALSAILTAYFMLMFVLTAKSGFNRGGSFFSLPDVNLIFTSPLKSSRVLFFGLFSQLGTSLLLGFLLIAQYRWMNEIFGVSARDMAALIAGYSFTIFSAQLFAMLMYSFTSGREKLRKTLKWVFYGIFFAYIAAVVLSACSGINLGNPNWGELLPRIIAGMDTLPAKLFPVTGWFSGIFLDIYAGSRSFLWIGAALFAVYLAGCVLALVFFKHDYYEDVLQSAEYNYSAITASKEGRSPEILPENIKVGKTGLGKGGGASVFYYKHRLENRRARKLILTPLELISALCTLAFGFFMRNIGGDSGAPVGLWMAVGFGAYMQIFTAALGRFPKELTKPYIYLIPEPPFRKLFHAVRESFKGMVIQAVLVFLPLGFLGGWNPLVTLMAAGAHISFSTLFLALNVLAQRIFGDGKPAPFTMIFYVLLLLALAAPGIALAILTAVLGFFLGISVAFTSLFVMTAANILVSGLVIFLNRNMLQYAEWNH